MPYTAEISRNNPSMFLFLIDQSGSMGDPFGGGEQLRKAEAMADGINRLLQNLSITCAKEEGVRDYFHVGVIAYGGRVGPAFGGSLAGRELVPISEVAGTPARMEMRNKKVSDGAGGLIDQPVKFPIWFDPVADGGTPMCKALDDARRIVQGWLSQHPNCFPPVVINITDGESTDGDPSSAATSLRGLSSTDGEVLLLNLHLSSLKKPAIEFPGSDSELPDQYAKLLFQSSSPLTPFMISVARQEGFGVTEGARGFVFNARLDTAIKFLEIGTRPSNLR
jgi:uncharacterized protein YegL